MQSTAELVAQISEQLQHYGTIFETSTLVSNGNKDTIKQQLQVHLEVYFLLIILGKCRHP